MENLENRLSALLCSIDGVSELSVMVTLESGVEYVYATEQKSNVNLLSDTLSGTEKRVENQNEHRGLLHHPQGRLGGESAVLVKRLEPVVQGVAIVCRGARTTCLPKAAGNGRPLRWGCPPQGSVLLQNKANAFLNKIPFLRTNQTGGER